MEKSEKEWKNAITKGLKKKKWVKGREYKTVKKMEKRNMEMKNKNRKKKHGRRRK